MRGRPKVLPVTAEEAPWFSHSAFIKHLLCARRYAGHVKPRCQEASKEQGMSTGAWVLLCLATKALKEKGREQPITRRGPAFMRPPQRRFTVGQPGLWEKWPRRRFARGACVS